MNFMPARLVFEVGGNGGEKESQKIEKSKMETDPIKIWVIIAESGSSANVNSTPESRARFYNDCAVERLAGALEDMHILIVSKGYRFEKKIGGFDHEIIKNMNKKEKLTLLVIGGVLDSNDISRYKLHVLGFKERGRKEIAHLVKYVLKEAEKLLIERKTKEQTQKIK